MRSRFLILSLSLAAALGFVALPEPAHSQTAGSPTFTYEERSIGSKDAPITIYEYSSLLCGHCASFHGEVLPKLKAGYIDTGKVRWVFRDHSLGQSWPLASAMIVRCAPADVDYKLRNMLMANARTWGQAQNPLDILKSYVALVGMNGEAVDACLKSNNILEGIVRYEKEANERGIDSTPSFVIQGLDKPVVGFRTYDQFRAILDPLVAKTR